MAELLCNYRAMSIFGEESDKHNLPYFWFYIQWCRNTQLRKQLWNGLPSYRGGHQSNYSNASLKVLKGEISSLVDNNRVHIQGCWASCLPMPSSCTELILPWIRFRKPHLPMYQQSLWALLTIYCESLHFHCYHSCPGHYHLSLDLKSLQ